MKYSQIVKELLQDRNVLYLTLFAALSNLFIYMVMREYQAIIFFIITGLLASYFSKNMILIMLTAIVATGVTVSLKLIGKVREGMESKMTEAEQEADEAKEAKGEDVSEAAIADQAVSRAQKKGNPLIERIEPVGADASMLKKDKPKINYADTLEEAYTQLDKLLESASIDKMSQQTERLAENQKKLVKAMETVEPMLDKAQSMLGGMDMDSIASTINKWQGLIKDLPEKPQKV
jgi:hypothetical protein